MAKLFTEEYKEQLEQLHKESPNWAKSGTRFYDQVTKLIDKHDIKNILDYGCGKGALGREIWMNRDGLNIRYYDPGIEKYSDMPESSEFVICTDVLEHVEPEFILNVLKHLYLLTEKIAYFVIHTGDCGHKLPDGRPAHILQRSQKWWQNKIEEVFAPIFDVEYRDTKLPMRFEVILERKENA